MAFVTRYGSYEFVAIPFGLMEALCAHEYHEHGILAIPLSFFIIFIDNILVYSVTKEEHALHLSVFLKTLRELQLYTKFSK